MLNARAIAMQGIGFATRFVALQGFVVSDSASVAAGRRLTVPRRIVDAQRLRAIDEDDTMMMLAAAVAAAYGGTN